MILLPSQTPTIMRTFQTAVAVWMLSSVFVASAANQNLFLPNVSAGTGSFSPTFASTGSTGVTNLTLPPDGRLQFTTITIPQNITVKFIRNALNTPVYLLASGDISIDGTIEVNGESGTDSRGGFGGPGGFDGGAPRDNRPGSVPGDGYGPGAGAAVVGDRLATIGRAAYGTLPQVAPAPADGQIYGTQLLMPLAGGSGGGGYSLEAFASAGGGGGGGAILIASSTRIRHNGAVRAWGGAPNGSGGAIRLLAPAIDGQGLLDVTGGGTAGHGRIRCDLIERSSFALVFVPASAPVTTDQFLALTTPPADVPTLRIVRVGNQTIPSNADAGYTVLLSPLNTPLRQDVVIEASGFNASVPIAIKLTPVTGVSSITEATINNGAINPARVTNSLPFPGNVPITVSVWTR